MTLYVPLYITSYAQYHIMILLDVPTVPMMIGSHNGIPPHNGIRYKLCCTMILNCFGERILPGDDRVIFTMILLGRKTCTFGPLNVPSRHDAHIGASIATPLGLRCAAGGRTTGLFEGHHACFTSWHARNREGCKYHNLDGFPRMLAAGISTSGLKLPHLFMMIWIRHMDCVHGF